MSGDLAPVIRIFPPQDFPAPCGCVCRFDNDGFVRFQFCNLHAAAPELLEACKSAVPFLCDHISMTIQEGPADRIALDKLEETIAKAEGKST